MMPERSLFVQKDAWLRKAGCSLGIVREFSVRPSMCLGRYCAPVFFALLLILAPLQQTSSGSVGVAIRDMALGPLFQIFLVLALLKLVDLALQCNNLLRLLRGVSHVPCCLSLRIF